jgi:hypothetical protein
MLGWLIIPFLLVDNFIDLNLVLIIVLGILFLTIIILNIRGIIGRIKFEDEVLDIDSDYRFDHEEQLQKAYTIIYKDIQKITLEEHDPINSTRNQPLVRGLRSDHLHKIKYGREPYEALVFQLHNGQKAKLILNAFSKKQQHMIYQSLIEKGLTPPKPSEVIKSKSPFVFRKLWDIFTFLFLLVFFAQVVHARIFGGNATPIPAELIPENPYGYYLISQGIATEVSYTVWLTNYILIWIAFLLLVTIAILSILHLIQKHYRRKSKIA